MEKIAYRITPGDPSGHYFDVVLEVANPHIAGQVFTLPAWIPGSYTIRDFAKHIVSFRANARGNDLKVVKIDKQTWRLDPADGPVSVVYRVYASDLSVRGAYLDGTHGYFNGTSVFLRVVGQEVEPCRVYIEPPVGLTKVEWGVATTLSALIVDKAGFGTYQAADYEDLIDHPVEMGRFESIKFDVEGIAHAMTVSGKVTFDARRLKTDLERICKQHNALFGPPSPIARYLFLVTAVGDGYGGLEHRDCSSLICRRDDLPRSGLVIPDDGYRRFLALCSHEYFHLWNVKRIRPMRLQAADLSREVHTELLWAFEGITSYYDELALVRSGCIDSKSYLELFAHNITRVMQAAGRLTQSIAESSFDAWTKFYKQDENAPNAIVSYYTKGGLVAFGLDMELRNQTLERVGLDDLMRALWERYGKRNIGVPEDGIETLATELAGTDLNGFFDRFVRGTEELPLADWLSAVGVAIRMRAANQPQDLGGYGDELTTSNKVSLVLGVRTNSCESPFVEIAHVQNRGAAHKAGLSAGDRIIAIDGIQVASDTLAKRIAQTPEGVAIKIHAFRRDELMEFEVLPQRASLDTCDLWLYDEVSLTQMQKQRRIAWLNGINYCQGTSDEAEVRTS